jgi:hypothetical protein
MEHPAVDAGVRASAQDALVAESEAGAAPCSTDAIRMQRQRCGVGQPVPSPAAAVALGIGRSNALITRRWTLRWRRGSPPSHDRRDTRRLSRRDEVIAQTVALPLGKDTHQASTFVYDRLCITEIGSSSGDEHWAVPRLPRRHEIIGEAVTWALGKDAQKRRGLGDQQALRRQPLERQSCRHAAPHETTAGGAGATAGAKTQTVRPATGGQRRHFSPLVPESRSDHRFRR